MSIPLLYWSLQVYWSKRWLYWIRLILHWIYRCYTNILLLYCCIPLLYRYTVIPEYTGILTALIRVLQSSWCSGDPLMTTVSVLLALLNIYSVRFAAAIEHNQNHCNEMAHEMAHQTARYSTFCLSLQWVYGFSSLIYRSVLSLYGWVQLNWKRDSSS